MKLNLLERLKMLQLLPEQGNMITLRIVGDLRRALAISEEEHERFTVSVDGSNIRWNTEVDTETDIEVGDVASGIIVESLQQLDEAELLTQEHMTLWEKFVDPS